MDYSKIINKNLYDYLQNNILPKYKENIGGHDIDHINYVINRSFEIIKEFNISVNYNIVYTIAMYHDIGYSIDPDNHEIISAKIFDEDKNIKKFFNNNEQKLIHEAIVDHRASLEYEPRSIYGKIVSSADRETSVENMLIRSLRYQRDKHANENPSLDDIINYSYKKLYSKYSKNNGYAKMYYKDKKYNDYIDEINVLLDSKDLFIKKEKELANNIDLLKKDNS